MNNLDLWQRYCSCLLVCDDLGVSVDVSRMDIPDSLTRELASPLRDALDAMDALEKGAVANPDEGRQVGHYWLRAPELAPTPALADAVRGTIERIIGFATRVHEGAIRNERASNRYCDIQEHGLSRA